MKTATGLALIAVGAILAFAVSVQTPGVNLQVAGFIVALTGLAGLALPSRASGWLRRRVVLRRGVPVPGTSPAEEASYPAEEASYSPSYLISDPAVMASQLLEEAELADVSARAGDAARAQASPASAVLHDLFND